MGLELNCHCPLLWKFMASYKQLYLTRLIMSSLFAVCFDLFSLVDLSISLFIIIIAKNSFPY
jgi:hypothetical protein